MVQYYIYKAKINLCSKRTVSSQTSAGQVCSTVLDIESSGQTSRPSAATKYVSAM